MLFFEIIAYEPLFGTSCDFKLDWFLHNKMQEIEPIVKSLVADLSSKYWLKHTVYVTTRV